MERILLSLFLFTTGIQLCFASNSTRNDNYINVKAREGTLTLQPLNQNAIRVRFTIFPVNCTDELVYLPSETEVKYQVTEDDNSLSIHLDSLSAVFDKRHSTLTFTDVDGRTILQEKAGGRSLHPTTVQGDSAYIAEQRFISPEDEHLFGTGQFQDGYLNIRGLSRRLTQVNTQISVPFVLSDKGYGILWNNYGMTDFNPADNNVRLIPETSDGQAVTVNTTSTSGNKVETRNFKLFSAEFNVDEDGQYGLLLDVGQSMARKHCITVDGQNVVDVNNLWLPPTTSAIVNLKKGRHSVEVRGEKNDAPVLYWRKVNDETIFRSPVAEAVDYTVFSGNADDVIASYRRLTGHVPMPPLWAFGYIHCRERYNSQAELLENASEFRHRGIPADVIVQDWQWWGKYGWNAMQFDEDKYPDPAEMVRELHDMDMRLMLSVWSRIDRNSALGKETDSHGYYIPGTEWIDFFNPEAASFYWDNFSRRLLKPYGIDAWWQDATEPENDDLLNRRINNGKTPGEFYRNIYPLLVNKTVYKGLRKDDPGRRAMILTRSAFTGIQRYGVVTWSGDVGNDWETLRRQIAGGLGQMASGIPWWTYDAGGFFRPSDQYTDSGYQERMLRWIQAGTFLPLMRVHGYMSQTEPWRYGERVEGIISKFIALRYRLLSYIYSHAAEVAFHDGTLMRPLIFDFPNDKEALKQCGEYMFGKSLLINPVTEGGVTAWTTYLPETDAGWIDFWTGNQYDGGRYVDVPVSIDMIPVFVRGGTILPLDGGRQHVYDKADSVQEIRIYPGADASFTLYEDEGNNYNYEHGAYCNIKFRWDNGTHTLTIEDRQGEYPGMKQNRSFHIISPDTDKTIIYSGKKISIKLK